MFYVEYMKHLIIKILVSFLLVSIVAEQVADTFFWEIETIEITEKEFEKEKEDDKLKEFEPKIIPFYIDFIENQYTSILKDNLKNMNFHYSLSFHIVHLDIVIPPPDFA